MLDRNADVYTTARYRFEEPTHDALAMLSTVRILGLGMLSQCFRLFVALKVIIANSIGGVVDSCTAKVLHASFVPLHPLYPGVSQWQHPQKYGVEMAQWGY